MQPRVARDLQDRVATIRSAVEDGRVFFARQQLGRLSTDVDELLDRGLIPDGTAIGIIDAVNAVRDALGLAPAASPTVAPTTEPPPPEDHGDEGKHHGEDKGHGHD
jgi:hypothetical protein